MLQSLRHNCTKATSISSLLFELCITELTLLLETTAVALLRGPCGLGLMDSSLSILCTINSLLKLLRQQIIHNLFWPEPWRIMQVYFLPTWRKFWMWKCIGQKLLIEVPMCLIGPILFHTCSVHRRTDFCALLVWRELCYTLVFVLICCILSDNDSLSTSVFLSSASRTAVTLRRWSTS